MGKQKEVILDFVNKKGQSKHVKFFMDKKTYEMLLDKTITSEERKKYLVEEYHEYERERYYKRRHLSLDLNKFLIYSIDDNHLQEIDNRLIEEAIEKLPIRQKEIIYKVYYEGKTQVKVAEELNVSKSTISITLSRALTNLANFFKNFK